MHWSEVATFGMKTVKQTASIYRVVPKGGAMHRLMTIILSILNRLKKKFSVEDALVNLQLDGY